MRGGVEIIYHFVKCGILYRGVLIQTYCIQHTLGGHEPVLPAPREADNDCT